MHKIIFSHLFVAFIMMGIWTYQPNVDGLMSGLIMSLITLEMGFLAFHSKNTIFKVVAIIIWCIFYPSNFKILLGVANVSFGGDAIWTNEAMKPFMVYLACLAFALVAATLSAQLILKSFKLNLYVQLVLMPIIAIAASFFLHLERVGSLGWGDFLLSPLNFVSQVLTNLASANIPFIIGLSAIQSMLLILLGDD